MIFTTKIAHCLQIFLMIKYFIFDTLKYQSNQIIFINIINFPRNQLSKNSLRTK